MTTMTISYLACFVVSFSVAADDSVTTLFEQAETLSRSNQHVQAMAKIEQAVVQLDRAHATGENLEWGGMNGLRFAAQLAREDLLDYEKSFYFCDKLFELSDSDYWRVPARLQRALTYRAMGDFDKAQAEYDAIATSDARQQTLGIMPQAEMVYFDLGDKVRGRKRITEALMNDAINGRERFNTLRQCATRALADGDRDEALGWYALVEKLPFDKAEERARLLSQAWFEMGRIEETRGRSAEAKVHYRKAMELEQGEMRYRTRARDALESIEYFE